jgi:hypothetical protein
MKNELLELVIDINDSFYELACKLPEKELQNLIESGELPLLEYSSTGSYEVVKYLGETIYSDDNNSRKWIEETDEDEPLSECIFRELFLVHSRQILVAKTLKQVKKGFGK